MSHKTNLIPQILHKRTIKSFVCRNTTLPPSKEALFQKVWPIYSFFSEEESKIPENFKNPLRSKVLEIGFGRGDSLFQMCKETPEQDFIGVEVYRPGLVNLLSKLEQHPLPNLRLYLGDALDLLAKLPDSSLDKVQIFFPDPWPKQRHHKRRIIQPHFLAQVFSKLKPQGLLHLASDWEEYAHHMMRVLSESADYLNCFGKNQYAPRPDSRPLTKYETRGMKLGHKTYDLIFQKVEQKVEDSLHLELNEDY